MGTFDSRDAAVAALKPDEVVCATILGDGKPVYFTMPKGVTDDLVKERAFEIRHGRKLSAVERTVDSFARRRRLWA
jgi:hypothetical protein